MSKPTCRICSSHFDPREECRGCSSELVRGHWNAAALVTTILAGLGVVIFMTPDGTLTRVGCAFVGIMTGALTTKLLAAYYAD